MCYFFPIVQLQISFNSVANRPLNDHAVTRVLSAHLCRPSRSSRHFQSERFFQYHSILLKRFRNKEVYNRLLNYSHAPVFSGSQFLDLSLAVFQSVEGSYWQTGCRRALIDYWQPGLQSPSLLLQDRRV